MAEVRSDSWASALTPDQQWELFTRSKKSGVWTQSVAWAVKEYGLKKTPSQSAFYRWREAMSQEALAQRIELASDAAAEATCISQNLPKDETLIAMFKGLAAEAALAGDVKATETYAKCAASLHDHFLKNVSVIEKLNEKIAKNNVSAKYAPYMEKMLKISMDGLEEDARRSHAEPENPK